MEQPTFEFATEKVVDTTVEQSRVILLDKDGNEIVKPITAKMVKIANIDTVSGKIE